MSSIREDSLRLSDPFQILPPEIWLQCMEEFIRVDSDGVLTLLLVSRLWCTIVCSTPSLWAQITIGHSEEALFQLNLYLQLSKSLPIFVTVLLPMREDTFTNNLLLKEGSRIKELTFSHAPPPTTTGFQPDVTIEEFYEAAFSIFSSFKVLPILEVLNIQHQAFGNYLMPMAIHGLPRTPALRVISNWSLFSNTIESMESGALRSIASGTPFEDLYSVLSQMPLLKRLELLQGTRFEGEDNKITSSLSDPNFPAIESVVFSQANALCLGPLLTFKGDSIIKLDVKVTWETLQQLIPLLFYTSSLSYLYLVIDESVIHEFDFGEAIPPLHQVTEFLMMQIDSRGGTMSSSNMGKLLDCFSKSMDHIQDITLDLLHPIPIVSFMNLLRSQEGLKRLSFGASIQTEGPSRSNEKEELSHMQELSLIRDSELMEYISVPNLYLLRVINNVSSNTPIPPTFERLHSLSIIGTMADALRSVSIPQLHRLVWYYPTAGCASASLLFPSLKALKFEHGPNRREANDFCDWLQRFPSKCPNLEELSFVIYPAFDLLFHMLIRRNFLPEGVAKRIKTIELPSLPSPVLLSPLTSLLSGRRCPIPSMLELSTDQVNDLYCNKNITGCFYCLLSRRSCQSEVEYIRQSSPSPNRGGGSTSLPAMKRTVDIEWEEPVPEENIRDWFDDWPRQREIWNKKWDSFSENYRRVDWCKRHDLVNLTNITGETLHGIPIDSVEMNFFPNERQEVHLSSH